MHKLISFLFLLFLLLPVISVCGQTKSLTDDDLSAKLKASNGLCVIEEDYDLGGSTIKVPRGCTLVFIGGSICNGTIDLNECKIEGSGIKCQVKNPGKYFYTLSHFLADINNESLNVSVVQTLLDNGVPVIIDYPQITFNSFLSVASGAVVQSVSDKRVVLVFPQSKGFVWDKKVDSQNNCFRGLEVKSKGNAFDFVNGGSGNRPYNVYFSTFSNLRVQSFEGDCFTAGVDNRGLSGDHCTFDNYFENIEVLAPNGSGFVGLASNTQHFVKMRCLGCGVSFFYNCSGVFDSCNGTWGSTPTFYKGTRENKDSAASYTCLFRNCNIESYKSVLFDCNDTRCYMELTFEDCSFYITPNNKGIIDYFPFDFAVLVTLRMRNSFFYTYNDGKYDKKHNLFRIGSLSSIINVDLDRDLVVMDNYSYKYTISSQKMDLITPNAVSTRPKNPQIGTQHFDQNIGMPIWWNGNDWVDATGNIIK